MQLLRNLMWPFSILYGIIVYARNWFYDIGIFNSNTFQTPTLCIGNLSVGGTGKTPMVEWVLRHLQDKTRVVVLSRGYKRKTKGFIMASASSTAEEIGDEPLQIQRKFPEVAVVVDENRSHGIRRIERLQEPQLILLDDAYQHRKVQPTASVLLTSYGDLYVGDTYLPTGNLRDSKSASKRANLIIVTKCPFSLKEPERRAIIKRLAPLENQKVLFCGFSYSSFVQNDTNKIKLASINKKKVMVVTGIANPEPLLDYLKSQKIDFTHSAYRDHHFYSEKEINFFNSAELVLTTEKDYMRLRGKVENLCYLEVQHKFMEDDASHFVKLLDEL